MKTLKSVKIIKTKYIGPTNYKGSRVKAIADCGTSVTESYKSELNADENALSVAQALVNKLAMRGQKLTGRYDTFTIDGIGSFNGEYFFTIVRSK